MDDLPDELLLQILQWLTPFDLRNISSLGVRYEGLILEKALWSHIDCLSSKAEPTDVSYFNEKVHSYTTAYLLKSADASLAIPLERIHKWRSYAALTVLALENVNMAGEEMTLADFPRSLVEVSFNRSTFKKHNFFRFAGRALTNLRVLTMEHCLTLRQDVLMSLANFEALEILSLYGCMGMQDALVSFAVGSKHGFKMLKVLDVRCTGLGDDLLRLTAEMEQLRELYFHCYFDYIEDYLRRQGDRALRAEQLLDYRHLDISELPGWILHRPMVRQYKAQFTDEGLRCYGRTRCRDQKYVPPDSVLYARPYAPCTCSDAAAGDAPSPPQAREARASTSAARAPSPGRKRARAPSPPAPAASASGVLAPPHSKKLKRDLHLGPMQQTSFRPYFRLADGEVRAPSPDAADALDGEPMPHRVIEVRFDRPVGSRVSLHDNSFVRISVHRYVMGQPVALSALSLRGSPLVTDAGLTALSHLNLALLDVTGTAVTRGAVAAFRACAPRCRVVHESACVCRPR